MEVARCLWGGGEGLLAFLLIARPPFHFIIAYSAWQLKCWRYCLNMWPLRTGNQGPPGIPPGIFCIVLFRPHAVLLEFSKSKPRQEFFFFAGGLGIG